MPVPGWNPGRARWVELIVGAVAFTAMLLFLIGLGVFQ